MDINFNDFDKIMIGLGDEFGIKYPDSCKDSWDEYIYTKEHDNDDILSAYNNLADRLLGKDYFVVTTCTDDIIYQSKLDVERIVAPCGGFKYLQCVDDCAHQLLPFEESMYEEHDKILCPNCKKEVVFNRLPLDKYNEGGYMDSWQEYNKWLQSTINKKLLIIEAGVGMAYPTVIRFPFEKTAFYNQKSVMYRVHESLAFSTPELKERCICIKSNSVEFISNL